MMLDQVIISFNAILAFIFGGIIGYSRIRSNRPAGIRTQALICAGSALITGLSITIGPNYGAETADPARLMAQIVTGIGFLGGGVILKNNDRLKGITTAAMIWYTAGVGMLLGASYYIPAFVAISLIVVNELIGKAEFKYGLKTKPYLLLFNKVHLKKLPKLNDYLPDSYRARKVNGKRVSFYFFSSKQKNKNLEQYLIDQSVKYSLIRQSSLKDSDEVFSEYA